MIETRDGIPYRVSVGPGRRSGVVVAWRQPATRPQLLVTYGDSYTATGPHPWASGPGWAQQVAEDLDLDLADHAVIGTGYVADAEDSGLPFVRQVETGPPDGAGVVVVFGSVNDQRAGIAPDVVGRAADRVLALVRALAPQARLLVIGPQWPAGDYAPSMGPLRDAVRASAQRTGAVFLDSLQWLAGRPDLISGDGLHPTQDGLTYLAGLIRPTVAALAAA